MNAFDFYYVRIVSTRKTDFQKLGVHIDRSRREWTQVGYGSRIFNRSRTFYEANIYSDDIGRSDKASLDALSQRLRDAGTEADVSVIYHAHS